MGQPVTTQSAPRHRRQDSMAGVEGNERLTAMTGALLLIGFAVEGVTVLEVRRLLVIHVLVGALLIGPVLLKVASTGYRFMRYYTGSRAYVRKGPPSPVLRVLGPLVILTSVAVLSTGIVLGIVGPGNGQWMFLHKASFILWFGVMTIHVLTYAPRLPRMLAAHPGGGFGASVPGGGLRWLGLVVSLAAGIGVAALAMHLSVKWGISA
ncbi:MAG TPA: hypothetical protein VMB74_01325 [Streptosporangiaceae bacterium]|nr:hypothetical protein [Streptosporangiaceae bacterium]